MCDTDTSLKPKRIRHSYPGAVYTLPADDTERSRLITQHHLLERVFGGNLLAPVRLKEDDEILDACTGTAIWLLELAKHVPETILLQGIDVETRQYPTPESRPNNLQLSLHSVLSLPLEWTDRFTLVHQRLVVDGLKRDEWPRAMKELYRVTKPGGWVELCETPDWSAGPVNEQWKKMLREIYYKLGLILDGGKDLERLMRDAGFVDLQIVEQNMPLGTRGGEDGKLQSDNLMDVWRGMKDVVLNAGTKTEQELDRWLGEMGREYDQLQGTISWVICFGRKGEHRVV